MPYLRHDDVLSRFSQFLREDVREGLPEEEEFLRGQVGSMASTMRFLTGELAGKAHALGAQETELIAALDELEAELESGEEDVEDAIAEARARLSDAPVPDSPETTRACEDAITTACEDVLSAVDELPADRARTLRRPLYEFLETRVESQLRMLGREDGNGDGENGGNESGDGSGGNDE